MKVEIFYKNSAVHALHVAPTDTVKDLLDKWSILYGIRGNARVLIFDQCFLDEGQTLDSYNIGEGSKILSAYWGHAYFEDKALKKSPLVECSVCFDDVTRRKVVSLEPCGHSGLCNTCARALKNCPECRESIKSIRPAKKSRPFNRQES